MSIYVLHSYYNIYIILVTVFLCEITENVFLFVFALLREILEWYLGNFLKLEKWENKYVLRFPEIFCLHCANLSWWKQCSHWLEFCNDN